MAGRQLVLNDVLCFLVNKLDKIDPIVLKSIIISFYKNKDISDAKIQLFGDITLLDLWSLLSAIERNVTGNDCENQGSTDIDDILEVLQSLNVRNNFEKLPKYVSAGPDLMPMCGVDNSAMISSMMARVDRIDEQLAIVLNAISTCVHFSHHAGSRDTDSCQSTEIRSVINPTSGLSVVHSQIPVAQPGACKVMSKQSTRSMKLNEDLPHTPLHTSKDWSAAMSTPQAVKAKVTDSTYDISCCIEDDDGNAPFIPVVSRKFKRPRRHSPDNTDIMIVASNANTENHLTQTRRGPLVFGKAKPGPISHGISAPKSYVRKSVYCVDNIDKSYSADDVISFVSDMSVRVLSCFEVRPRKRRSGAALYDHKAFRLCINSDDQELLLDASKWPAYVTVSNWHFKKPDADIQHDIPYSHRNQSGGDASSTNKPNDNIVLSQQQHSMNSYSVPPYGPVVQATTSAVDEITGEADMDTTVIVNYATADDPSTSD